jgi:hypothetical protein
MRQRFAARTIQRHWRLCFKAIPMEKRNACTVIQRALGRMRAVRIRRHRPSAMRTIMVWLAEQHKNKAVPALISLVYPLVS